MDFNAPVCRRTRRQCDLRLERLYAESKGIEPSPSVPVPVPVKELSSSADSDSSEESEGTDSDSGHVVHRKGKRKRVVDDDSTEVIVLDDSDDGGEEEIGSASASVNVGFTERNEYLGEDADDNGSRTEEIRIRGGGGRGKVSKKADVDDDIWIEEVRIGGCGGRGKGVRKANVDEVANKTTDAGVESESESGISERDCDDDYWVSADDGKDIELGLSSSQDTSDDDFERGVTLSGVTIGESEKKRKKEVEEKHGSRKSKNWPTEELGRKGRKGEGKGRAAFSKNLDIYRLLANSIWEKDKPLEGEEEDGDITLEESHDQTRENPHKVPLPLKFTFGIEEPEPMVKSEEEIELENLWAEMDFASKCEEVGSNNFAEVEDENANRSGEANSDSLCSQGMHKFVLDEEIGIYCTFCHYVKDEIRHIFPPVEKLPTEVSSKKISSNGGNISFDVLQGDFGDPCNDITDGTVWSIIPGTRQTMYPHQQEGFEFVWRNLAGTTDLEKLKNNDSNGGGGGCIISHAPGTGKTRLTLVFLQSYLKLFPNCRPVIFAPASLLLTWEEEFQKWDVGIPFHNINNRELSGKEDTMAVSILERARCQNQFNPIRMVKLYSWSKKESILGISYSLFMTLVGDKGTVGIKNERLLKEAEEMKKILLELPGLLVLDEGHTPRNKRSRIWNALTKLKTEKRIILSGTPFQNNFHELYNTLKIVRPAFEEKIPLRLKQFGKYYYNSRKKLRLDEANEKKLDAGSSVPDDAIEEFRCLMSPFVHVHKGNILLRSVPGLKDCVVVLTAANVQKKLLEIIEHTQSPNVLDFEHKLSMVSVHPTLLLDCALSEKEEALIEESSVGRGVLEKLRYNHSEGVKMRFLIEFVRLMQATKEKVLVFSQFIPPLDLIMEQLASMFNWSKGKEVLHMHGKLDHKERQATIHVFNDPDSEAKVLLASTKACSEGISLIGASRVILLDVVWNPSVERQAISRAYRLGQKRLVFTYHLIVAGTAEWKKYRKQTEKERISELVFTSTTKEDGKQTQDNLSSEDQVLDELVQHDKLKDVFKKIIYQPKEASLLDSFS
ncbi:SNF2 domain-containing protein CLASSY 3 [Tripterygium wilfordii]|uniref:SNF2 domain-containing protein CLASSY 3 n=1 Tax=Tripterygium wilfordii TaxID=458696 RepID=UPI0018F815C0|nr:SNF2 domain-containing protein CLASSY 3 [Tripterygium wilfordii]